MFYAYGEAAVNHLKQRDKKLGDAIDAIGPIEREMDEDLFESVVCSIIGQQISGAAQATICRRLRAAAGGTITPEAIDALPLETLQACGTSFKKAGYIKAFTAEVAAGNFDICALPDKTDAQVVKALSAFDGIGTWTAEMLCLFCLGRQDILSYGDLAIHRGLRMLYRHKKVDKKMFEKFRKRYSPYGSVASLYLWAISGGALAGASDPAAKEKKK